MNKEITRRTKGIISEQACWLPSEERSLLAPQHFYTPRALEWVQLGHSQMVMGVGIRDVLTFTRQTRWARLFRKYVCWCSGGSKGPKKAPRVLLGRFMMLIANNEHVWLINVLYSLESTGMVSIPSSAREIPGTANKTSYGSGSFPKWWY